jgi:hypothetical protein
MSINDSNTIEFSEEDLRSAKLLQEFAHVNGGDGHSSAVEPEEDKINGYDNPISLNPPEITPPIPELLDNETETEMLRVWGHGTKCKNIHTTWKSAWAIKGEVISY